MQTLALHPGLRTLPVKWASGALLMAVVHGRMYLKAHRPQLQEQMSSLIQLNQVLPLQVLVVKVAPQVSTKARIVVRTGRASRRAYPPVLESKE